MTTPMTSDRASRRTGVPPTWLRLLAVALYLGAVVGSNWLTDRFGEVTVLPGVTVIAGTFAAGLAILTRNLGQEALGQLRVVGLMIVGGLLSWWLASPEIAVASVVAFGVSEGLDMTVFTALRGAGTPRALAFAGVAGSIADTALFLGIAHYVLGITYLPVTVSVVVGQLLVKAGISLLGAAGAALGDRWPRE